MAFVNEALRLRVFGSTLDEMWEFTARVFFWKFQRCSFEMSEHFPEPRCSTVHTAIPAHSDLTHMLKLFMALLFSILRSETLSLKPLTRRLTSQRHRAGKKELNKEKTDGTPNPEPLRSQVTPRLLSKNDEARVIDDALELLREGPGL